MAVREAVHAASQVHASLLPYTHRHLEVLACETCHIPSMYAPAIEYYDWTALKMDGQPVNTCRGIELTNAPALVASTQADYNIPITVTNLVTGYEPVLMMRQNVEGDSALAPYNLVTAWYWVYDDANDNTRPVRLEDLQAAWFSQNDYAPEILAAFDEDRDGKLNQTELVLDSQEKRSLIASRLEALGLRNPRIHGEIQPYSISHDICDASASNFFKLFVFFLKKPLYSTSKIRASLHTVGIICNDNPSGGSPHFKGVNK